MAKSESRKVQISLSWWMLCVLLVATNIATVVLWKPWASDSTTRKITVTGQSTVKASPDEYVLSPYFEFTNGAHTKLLSDAASTATQLTDKFKSLGVKDTQIKSNTSSYDKYAVDTSSTTDSVQLNFTITLSDKDVAQKVQDYLLTTAAKGQLSPTATFSEDKQKQLEADAREKAIADAKAKAARTAENVGAKVGKVVTITDEASGGGIRPMLMTGAADSSVTSSYMPVQSGLNDFTSTVQVEFELK